MLNFKIGDILEDEGKKATVVEVKESSIVLEWEDGSKEEVSKEELTESFEDKTEVTETTAAETLKTHASADSSNSDPKSKLDALKAIMHNLAARSTTDVINHYNEMIAQIGKETEKLPGSANASSNAASIKAKPSAAVKEDMDTIFAGTEFTEEFKSKASTLFDAAVSLKITEETVRLEEAYEVSLAEAVEEIETALTENLNDYLDYVAEKWLEDNQVAVESTLRNEMMSGFIDGLKGLFEEHYIDIPEDKIDVLTSVVSEKEKLEAKYNDLVNENIELTKVLEEAAKNEVFDDIKEGLTLTQLEKFRTLAEGIEFTDLDTYKAKLLVVKENYFSKNTKSDTALTSDTVEEQTITEGTKYIDPTIAQLARAIKRSK